MQGSASRAELLLHCQYPFRPDVVPLSSPPSEYADYGRAVHRYTELMGRGEPIILGYDSPLPGAGERSLAAALRDAKALHDWHSQRIAGDKHYEIKFAFDWSTGDARRLTSTVERDYSECTATEWPGTADLVSVGPDALCVLDYKTGFTPWDHYVGQLNLLGICAARVFGRDLVHCVVLKVIDGECFREGWILNAGDMESISTTYQKLMRGAAESTAEPTPSYRGCVELYCPAVAVCPYAKERIMTDTGTKVDTELTDAESAVRAYETHKLLTRTDKQLKYALQMYAEEHEGIKLPNGKTWKKVNGKFKEVKL